VETKVTATSHNYFQDKLVQGSGWFQCKICMKIFRSRYKLNRHSVVHALEKPFDCQICGVKFSRVDNLKRHMESKHLEMNSLKLPAL